MEISVEDARELLASLVRVVEEVENVALGAAVRRVLAADLVCSMDVPPHDNSAMDGYALASSSASPLRVVGIAHAGKPYAGSIGGGECVRILTGAVIPADADAVVMQERVRREDDVVHLEASATPGQNVRRAGEDLARGSIVLRAGRVLRAGDIGAAASLGLASLGVRRKPRVGFFTTGDELRPAGSTLASGQLFDSNGPLVHALVASAGFDPVDLGHAPDDAARIDALAREASPSLDALISTGGVAVGDADCVQQALARSGVRSVEVAMKPGRHLAVGTIDRCAFFGLPGNPVAVLATFDQLVLPALRAMAGISDSPRLRVPARTTTPLRNVQARIDFQRGIASRASDGSLVVRSTGPQGAGILRSVVEANCFIVVPASAGAIAVGSPVEIELFE